MCEESNGITGEKIVLCLLLIRSEKNCTFKLRVGKKFDHKKNHAPHVSNGPPLRTTSTLPESVISEIRHFLMITFSLVPDFYSRHNVWGWLFGDLFFMLSMYAASQFSAQRFCSVASVNKARL